jgi:hypothetical protein
MRRTSASRSLQLVCLLFVCLLVLEPAVLAAGPCAAGRVLGAIDACCCSENVAVSTASETSATSSAPRSCCAQSAETEPATGAGGPMLRDARAPGCRCELEAPPLSPTRDRGELGPAGGIAFKRWIADGADASAAAPDAARFTDVFGAGPVLARSDGALRPDAATRRCGSTGCARHALLSGGVGRLLAIYCSALL